ncbi:MAG: DUF6062 family protein [Anaerolineae bacterium]
MGKHIPYFELMEAMGQPGCPICRLASKAVVRYLDGMLYEQVSNPDVRRQVRSARGFCPRHAWQLRHQQGVALQIAILYQDVIQDLVAILEAGEHETAPSPPWQKAFKVFEGKKPISAAERLVDALQISGECLACQAQRSAEEQYLDELQEHLGEEEVDRAFTGLCLAHFRQALGRVRSGRALRLLVETQLKTYRLLQADLEEMIRKHDYRFSEEGFGEEGDAWIRAVVQIAGPEE